MNAWMPKEGFLGLYVGMVLFTALMMSLTVRAIASQPDARINLPNKEHWLAPERRRATMDATGSYLAWFGAATNLLLLDVFGQAISVNLARAERLDHPLASLGVYAAFSVVWTAAFMRRFTKAS